MAVVVEIEIEIAAIDMHEDDQVEVVERDLCRQHHDVPRLLPLQSAAYDLVVEGALACHLVVVLVFQVVHQDQERDQHQHQLRP